jgi:hypothetical protein
VFGPARVVDGVDGLGQVRRARLDHGCALYQAIAAPITLAPTVTCGRHPAFGRDSHPMRQR